ncbi:MAG: efflux RND transporter periplasmic adaptor subunit [Pseudonocardia sp.]
MPCTTVRRGRWTWSAGLVALLAVSAALAGCGGTEAPPPTVRVDRGPVSTTVSASGSLVAITEQNLGFAEGGELREVLVRVGDRVTQGQVLARLDDFELRQTLAQQQAQLAQQQSTLNQLRGGNSVEAARATLEQAERILSATKNQAKATNAANASATDRARTQLRFDRSVLEKAESRLRADQAACGDDAIGAAGTGASPVELDLGPDPGPDPDPDPTQESPTTPIPTNPACERIAVDKAAVREAKRVVLASEAALDAAEQQEKVDAAAGRVAIENARQSVVAARNDLDTASNDRPAEIATQEAAVADARAAVALAQRAVDDTVLIAPMAGLVAAINGAVGEVVGPVSGVTPLAPGSTSALPITGGFSNDAGSTGVQPPGVGAFLLLDGVDSFQLVVPFEESDAARLAPNQRVEVRVDAIPDLTSPGTVLAIAPSGSDVSGIINYFATVVLTESDPRLRDGQTAEAAVLVESVENALRVPAAVVERLDGRTVVRTPGPDGAVVPVPFEAGLVGDEFTEVRSGLTEGQVVIRPQAEVASTGATQGPPR